MRKLAQQAVFGENKEEAREKIKKAAEKAGVFLSSTQALYEKVATGEFSGFTVPAFNIRTLTFDVAKALFRAARKGKAGPFIIELAQSEMAYTNQSVEEYAAVVLAAACQENFKDPLFLQGDHFKLSSALEQEVEDLEGLIKASIKAGFYNIDIDVSALPLEENIKNTQYFTNLIRKLEPAGLTISVGGEVGEIGGENTTVEVLKQFMEGYQSALSKQKNLKGIIKVAVQTGTSHGKGGIIDWQILTELSRVAKEQGLAGIVQHGASTLPAEQFKEFPKCGVCEIHLATEFQNIILESPHFPQELKQKIHSKKDLGPLKKEIWSIPQKNINKIAEELEAKFRFFFKALNISGMREVVDEVYPHTFF